MESYHFNIKTMDTNKMPFSNGTDFLIWKDRNCDKCSIYENKSQKRSESKCKYAFDLDFAQVSGLIPIDTINYFGYREYYNLADCPRLHCGRLRNYVDYQKALKKAESNKKNELPLKF